MFKNYSLPNCLLGLGLLILALLTAPVMAERDGLYQWIDHQGIDSWGDKNPLTDPSQRPIDAHQDAEIPGAPTVTAISIFLRSKAANSIPNYCGELNSDNPAQRAICEQYQVRALNGIEQALTGTSAPNGQFLYLRCRDKWLKKQPQNFLDLARCMGVEV